MTEYDECFQINENCVNTITPELKLLKY